MKKITCFLPLGTQEETLSTIKELKKSDLVSQIYVVCNPDQNCVIDGVEVLKAGPMSSGKTVRRIAALANTRYTLIYTR